ncbi:LysE family translocator [Paenibacillus sp. N1-5-1-14]|uniref:LysE family translocator n=1 Tax=Paenibacillus radicibacter TaxID=2972488 RepID=UPI00215934ED|nr:LysE family translocator [Paenibacillus radicibacter]MCR8644392.1 LysE family translocator [Paenibacillus radicibacter]
MLFAFIQGFLLSISLCLDLGMANVAIIKTGIERGFRSSFLIGFGTCFGDLFYLTLALIGVTAVFQLAWVKWIVWIVGTAVLLWLTYKMAKDAIKPKVISSSNETTVQRSGWKDFIFGIGVAVSSPTAILWFAVVAGAIIAQINMVDRLTMGAFVVGFFVAGLVWSFAVAWISSKSGNLLGQKFVRGISVASAIIFLYFSVKVFMDGLDRVLGK